MHNYVARSLVGTSGAAILALLAPPPSLAQDLPPAYRQVDENGFDLTHGDFVFSFADGSVGAGAGLL